MADTDIIQASGPAGADAATKVMLHNIATHERKFMSCETPAEREQWLYDAAQMLLFCRGVEEGSLKGQAATLIMIQRVWADLPEEFRRKNGDDFWRFAETRTGKSRITLENHMRAIRIFFVERVAPAFKVSIPVRDKLGEPVLDSAKSPSHTHVDFDPINIPIAKLVAIAGKAKAGQMTAEMWSAAADPGCTWEQLHITLGGGGGGGSSGIKFHLSGSYLFAKEDDQEAYIGDLSLPPDDDEMALGTTFSLRERALRRLMVVLDVQDEGSDTETALARNGLSLQKSA